MKKRKIYAKLTTVVLLFVIISALFVTVAFAGAGGDYSKPGAGIIHTLTSADVLSELIGEPLPDKEAAYLSLYGELKISYGAHIPTTVVGVVYDEQTGDFSVIAKKYAYVAENGANVFVAGSAYFKAADPAAFVSSLK